MKKIVWKCCKDLANSTAPNFEITLNGVSCIKTAGVNLILPVPTQIWALLYELTRQNINSQERKLPVIRRSGNLWGSNTVIPVLSSGKATRLTSRRPLLRPCVTKGAMPNRQPRTIISTRTLRRSATVAERIMLLSDSLLANSTLNERTCGYGTKWLIDGATAGKSSLNRKLRPAMNLDIHARPRDEGNTGSTVHGRKRHEAPSETRRLCRRIQFAGHLQRPTR